MESTTNRGVLGNETLLDQELGTGTVNNLLGSLDECLSHDDTVGALPILNKLELTLTTDGLTKGLFPRQSPSLSNSTALLVPLRQSLLKNDRLSALQTLNSLKLALARV